MRQSNFYGFTLASTFALLIALALPSQAAAQATVGTDYPDYYPGDVVIVFGSGWLPGETVSLTFDESPVQHDPHVLHTTADSTGSIWNSDYLVEEENLGSSYILTARGLSSGLTAQTTFTDSPKVGSVRVDLQSGLICSTTGGDATTTVTVDRGSGGGSAGAFTANLSITTALPSGVTASFSPNPVSFTPGQSTRTATLTFTASGATTPGTTSFTVRAATSANDFATGDGSLAINEPPTLSCPTSITLANDPGQCGAIVMFEATAAGTPAPVVTYSQNPGTSFPVGTTTVTATATNACGAVSCTFTVTVLDSEKPSITVANQNLSTDPGQCFATIASLGASATDNCGVGSLVGTRSDGAELSASYPQGTTTISWVATDLHGNTQTASQTVTVNDTENPTITAPAALTRSTGPGATSCDLFLDDASLGSATAADNCEVSVASSGIPAGNVFPVGTTTITYTATDPTGNTATATQTITVVDDTKPVIATADITLGTDPGVCTATAALATSATDNCGLQSLVGTRGDGAALTDPYPTGTTTISWLATDIHGNTSTATQTVTVTDHELPAITVADLSVVTDAGQCTATIGSLGASAADNCGVASLTGTRSDGAALSDPYPQGTTTVSWLATDIHGNAVGATQHVMVADPELPAVTAPAALHLTTGPGATQCGVTIGDAQLGTATATDNCSVTVSRSGVPAGNFFPVGTTTITYTATDPTGNSATATQTVTVVDDTPPEIVMPNQALSTAPGSCSATITDRTVAATDNCGVQSTEGTRGDGLALTDPFPVGTTTIIWTVTDLHGNTGTTTQTITVTDTELPTLTTLPAVKTSTGPGATTCGAYVDDATLGTATAGDNCSATVTRTGVPAGNLFPIGTTVITYTATDPSGNTISTTQDVTVTDDTPPSLTIATAVVDSTGPGAALCGLHLSDTALGVVRANDNCSVTVERTGVPAGHLFPVGTTTIIYTATDPSGNTTIATQTVTILDRTPAIITTADIGALTDPNACVATIASLGTSSEDGCGTPTLDGARSDGAALTAAYPNGVTTILWTATDAAGNVSTATQTITVKNGEPIATITGPPSGTIVPVGVPVTFTGTFTDNAGDVHTATWTCDASSTPGTVDESARTVTGTRTFTTAGVFLVKLVVADQCGGTSTATQVNGLDAMIVVYDPSAGFVTGGGWIQSPAGAYAESPALTGKANFGFVSKYKKGASTPTGETEFQFKAGDLNFHSASYEWLVISGARAQFKGTGTINGAGSYGFLLSAIDGQTNGGGGKDKFRIKITNKGTGLVVYDNQMGAPDSSAATTLLGGGSIAIQTHGGQLSAALPSGAMEGGHVAEAPAATALFQNRPNPFNPETAVRFTLARAGTLSLRVFNVRGSLVRTLADGPFAEGAHTLRWNATDDAGHRVPSGVYYALLSASDGTTSRIRMVLLK